MSFDLVVEVIIDSHRFDEKQFMNGAKKTLQLKKNFQRFLEILNYNINNTMSCASLEEFVIEQNDEEFQYAIEQGQSEDETKKEIIRMIKIEGQRKSSTFIENSFGLTLGILQKFKKFGINSTEEARPNLLEQFVINSLKSKAAHIFTVFLEKCEKAIPDHFKKVVQYKRDRYDLLRNENLIFDFIEANQLLTEKQMKEFKNNLDKNSKEIIWHVILRVPSSLCDEILLCFHLILEKLALKQSMTRNSMAIQSEIQESVALVLYKHPKIVKLTFEPESYKIKHFFIELITSCMQILLSVDCESDKIVDLIINSEKIDENEELCHSFVFEFQSFCYFEDDESELSKPRKKSWS